MKQLIEVFLVMIYNLAILAGASYLYVEHDVSAWIFALPIIFAASWNTHKKDSAGESLINKE